MSLLSKAKKAKVGVARSGQRGPWSKDELAAVAHLRSEGATWNFIKDWFEKNTDRKFATGNSLSVSYQFQVSRAAFGEGE